MNEDKKRSLLTGKTAIITGGSKGIGKATAEEIIKYGGNVCIIARKKPALNNAVKEISAFKINENQFVESISCDTTDQKALTPHIKQFIKKHGVPDYLINCVGYAYPQYIEKLSLKDFKDNMDINYFGQLAPILTLLPYFMKERKGHIANCSSAAGFLGMMGYSSYTPTKFAIVGLTECLRHELKPYDIGCSLLYPPDTDTPGFENENKTKPVELAIMSEGGGLEKPEDIAAIFVKGILKKQFYILPGQSSLLWKIQRHFPKLMQKILDHEYKKAIKKIKKK